MIKLSNKKLSCRRETARCVVPLNISLAHSRSLKSFKMVPSESLGTVSCFLFAFHSNYGSILYHFRDKVSYWRKIAIFFHTSLHIRGSPSEYRHAGETRMVWLIVGMWQTDRQTDRQVVKMGLALKRTDYTRAYRRIRYCDHRVCLCVCLSVCLCAM